MKKIFGSRLGRAAVVCGLTFSLVFSAGVLGDVEARAAQTTAGVKINTQTFPDSVFRSYVKKYVDKNKDGKLSVAERNKIKTLNVSGRKIGNLEGIRYFNELRNLDCSNNKLRSLKLDKNVKLVTLNCSKNKLTGLDIKANVRIYDLDCSSNRLTKLDLSKDGPLTYFNCKSNRLTKLDLSANPYLSYAYCDKNRINQLVTTKKANVTYTGNPAVKVKKVDAKPLKKGQYIVEMTQTASLENTYKCYVITNAGKSNPTVTLVDIGDIEVSGSYWEDAGYETMLGKGYTVTAIGEGALAGHTIIEDSFDDQDNKRVMLDRNLRRLGNRAFARCKGMKNVVLAGTISTLGNEVFDGCKGMKTLTIRSTRMTEKTLSKNSFKGITSATVIKVPKTKLKAYKKLFRKCGLGKSVKIVAMN